MVIFQLCAPRPLRPNRLVVRVPWALVLPRQCRGHCLLVLAAVATATLRGLRHDLRSLVVRREGFNHLEMGRVSPPENYGSELIFSAFLKDSTNFGGFQLEMLVSAKTGNASTQTCRLNWS